MLYMLIPYTILHGPVIGLYVKDLAFSPTYLMALFIGSLDQLVFIKFYLHSQKGTAIGQTLYLRNFNLIYT